MAGEGNSKLKIVYVMKILLERTDETHAVTMQEILDALAEYDISAERKSVYNDIELLRQYGLDIIGYKKDKTFYYYIGQRQFELAELKLLVDSVQSARFITRKKSNALIKKIEGIASRYEASQLQRQVYVTERVKSDNEQILINIDAIHRAISENAVITFKYFNWNEKKKQVLRHDGKIYEMSPWALTLSDENYYLVCFDGETASIKYFRVDKMLDITLTDRPRAGRREFSQFDIASYARKRFRMYDGEEQNVKLKCKNSFAGIIIDRFGRDINLIPAEDGYFTVNVDVAVSEQFLAWVFSMHSGMRIVSPENVVQKAREMAQELMQDYGG